MKRSLWRALLVSCAASGLMSCQGSAQAAPSARSSQAADLGTMSLEELMNVEVTSASRRPERLADAAASIFVISGEDIRRSGVTTLPEALRLAPNLHVAQGHASGYAINARGLNNSGANKLLVLIDGRSVYTPLFSGVFWDVQDLVLEDVERIEVLSGPGGTLWGTNAVNGVINVITRSAKDTQGGLAAAGAGNREWGGTLRYGGSFGANGSYRVYGKHLDHDRTSTPSGAAKTECGGDECILTAGLIDPCVEDTNQTAWQFLNAFGEAPTWGSIEDTATYADVVGTALAQIVGETCMSIPPAG